MRYLLKTQPYEKPIAAGSFEYQRDGIPLGIVEHWQYSHALDGFKFFRIDVDARKLDADGYSTLYNVVIGPNGRPETVKFRHFSVAPPTAENGLKIRGQIDLEPESAFVFREVNGERFEGEFSGSFDLLLPTASQSSRKNRSDEMLTLDSTDHFRPIVTAIQPEILEIAESGYAEKVKFLNGMIATSTRLTIYR
ncbi:MAG: hypothetical protein ACI9EW_001232 [Cellvibrionaceae bacterium]|jgi:hypothetical protein